MTRNQKSVCNTIKSPEQSNRNHLVELVFLSLIVGSVAVLLWVLSKNHNEFIYWIIRFGSLIFGFYSLFILINILPDGKFKKILFNVVGYPLGVMVEFLKLGHLVYTIIFSIIIVFVIFLAILLGLGKIIKINLNDFRLYYFISFFTILVIMAYFKNVLGWVLRFMHLPRSEKKDNHYKEVAFIINKVNFRNLAYIIGFLVYFLGTIDKFYDKTVINFPWWLGVKDVALEGLVAFVTLDACISLVFPKMINGTKI